MIFLHYERGIAIYNSQFWVKRLKKYLKIGSFFYNYFLIFRHQIDLKFKIKYNIISAFGGMGIYNLLNQVEETELNENYPEDTPVIFFLILSLKTYKF